MITRQLALRRIRSEIDAGRAIVGAGAGTGLSAKCAEAGRADLIVIYNSGRYRMAGRGSLAGLMPYGDANQVVEDMAREVLPVVKDVPVLAGVCGTDPFRVMRVLLSHFKAMGFSGVQNFPTVGLCDGVFRANLEATGMSYQLEVEMIAEARSQDLLTAAYVFDETQAMAMTTAGADILVAHAGLTTSGYVGAQESMSLSEAATFVQGVRDAAASIREDVIVICHGGPIATPADAEQVIRATQGVVGFFGASSVERLPTETAITSVVQRFKDITWREND